MLFSEDENILFKDKNHIYEMKRCRTDHVFWATSSLEEDFDKEKYYSLLEKTVAMNSVKTFADVETIIEEYSLWGYGINDKKDKAFVDFLLKNYIRGEYSGDSNIGMLYNEKRLEVIS